MARSIVDRWVSRLKASAREEIQETARSALLYSVAAVAMLLAIVFLTMAAFWWLAAAGLSAVAAALIIAAFYAVVAALVLISASSTGEPATVQQSAPHRAVIQEAYSAPRDMPDKMGVNLDSVAKTLADAGFRTESLVVTASSDLVRQLTPLQFVGLVFVGSFLFGRRLRR